MSDPYDVPPVSTPGWPPAQWQPPPAPVPHEQPQPYHRILRTRTYAWWRPVLGSAIFVGVFVLLAVIVIGAALVADLVSRGGDFDAISADFLTEITPLALLANNLTLAAAIPAAMLAILVAHRLRPGWLGSVAARLRWGLLARFTLLAAAAVIVFTAAGTFLPVGDEGLAPVQPVTLSEFATFAAVILLTTPLQAAGEEYAFRGYGLQVLGAYFRSPWIPALVTSLLFALAHGGQDLPLFLDRLAFGLVACWLVIRTGGLEASIALHVMNNMLVFLVAAAFGQVGDSLTVSEAPWPFVMLDITQLVAFAWLATRIARRREVERVTAAAG